MAGIPERGKSERASCTRPRTQLPIARCERGPYGTHRRISRRIPQRVFGGTPQNFAEPPQCSREDDSENERRVEAGHSERRTVARGAVERNRPARVRSERFRFDRRCFASEFLRGVATKPVFPTLAAGGVLPSERERTNTCEWNTLTRIRVDLEDPEFFAWLRSARRFLQPRVEEIAAHMRAVVKDQRDIATEVDGATNSLTKHRGVLMRDAGLREVFV